MLWDDIIDEDAEELLNTFVNLVADAPPIMKRLILMELLEDDGFSDVLRHKVRYMYRNMLLMNPSDCILEYNQNGSLTCIWFINPYFVLNRFYRFTGHFFRFYRFNFVFMVPSAQFLPIGSQALP